MIKSIMVALLFVAPLYSETLVLSSKLNINDTAAEFGGMSGIVITDNGRSFFAVSDKGTIWRGNLERDETGQLKSSSHLEFRNIKTSKGVDVDGQNIDAEEVDIDGDGRLYISFESNSRVSMFETWDAPATLIQRPSEFLDFGYNSGPEAMSIGPKNSILVAPERSGELERPFPIYAREGDEWNSKRNIRREPPYLLVGMDYDAESNRLYVLERDFKFPTFSTRIRSFAYGEDELSDEQLLLQTNYSEYGNLEGMSVWRDDAGAPHLSLITDDNFSMFFNTIIVEFKITD